MIANAFPPPLAYEIGRVILARQLGESVPAIDPSFHRQLADRVKAGTLSPAGMNNIIWRLERARRMLKGRSFPDINQEIAALEAAPEFARLDLRVKSDLRGALRLYAKLPCRPSPYLRIARPRHPFGRRETKWEPRWVVEPALIPTRSEPLTATRLRIDLSKPKKRRRTNGTDGPGQDPNSRPDR